MDIAPHRGLKSATSQDQTGVVDRREKRAAGLAEDISSSWIARCSFLHGVTLPFVAPVAVTALEST